MKKLLIAVLLSAFVVSCTPTSKLIRHSSNLVYDNSHTGCYVHNHYKKL